MRAFMTGSHAYGTPNEKSDVDLVVHVDDDTRCKLAKLVDFDIDEENKYGHDVHQFKVGNLNLIMVDDNAWEAWMAATVRLRAIAPVTRDQAIAIHRQERARRDIGGQANKPDVGAPLMPPWQGPGVS